jgi:hypothetical protein
VLGLLTPFKIAQVIQYFLMPVMRGLQYLLHIMVAVPNILDLMALIKETVYPDQYGVVAVAAFKPVLAENQYMVVMAAQMEQELRREVVALDFMTPSMAQLAQLVV